jgi:outer membrane protein assembly factor BamB
VTELDARTGATLSEKSFGEPLRACVVHVDGHRPAGPPRDVTPLVAQISGAVLADDPQLALAQKLLLSELGDLQDPEATKTLIDLASDPRTSPVLVEDARTRLGERRTGASYLEAALAKHYDFMSGSVKPPPVAPMAHAVATMKDRAAAPLLAEHLLDPADTGEDLREAAAALQVVATPAQMPLLRRFFGMYRANATNGDTMAALASVAKAMIAVGGSAGLKIVEDAANDTITPADVKTSLEAVLEAPPEAPGEGDAGHAQSGAAGAGSSP